MTDSRVPRRRVLGWAAGVGATAVAGPMLGRAAASTMPVKGVAPGKLMYLARWDIERHLDAVASVTPGGWVRTDLDWATIERVPGTFDWTMADYVMQAAARRGLPTIAILGTAPSWANGGLGWNVPPVDPSLMARFARAAAARYGPGGAAFEIWNEPNYTDSWRWPNPSAYTALLRVAYREIKAVSPASLVVTGGLAAGGSPRPVEFLRGMYAAGARGSFDALGYHPYCASSSPMSPGSGLLRTADLRSVLVEKGDGAKQIWGTEIGWKVEFLGVGESTQATYLSQSYAKWREWQTAGWVGPLLWFNLRDSSSLSILDHHSHFGLHRSDWTPRPAWWALRNA